MAEGVELGYEVGGMPKREWMKSGMDFISSFHDAINELNNYLMTKAKIPKTFDLRNIVELVGNRCNSQFLFSSAFR